MSAENSYENTYSAAARMRKNRAFTALCIFSASVSVIVLGVLLASLGAQGYTYLITRATPCRCPTA